LYICYRLPNGVEVIDHTSFTYTGQAQSFEWVDCGFKLHIPETIFLISSLVIIMQIKLRTKLLDMNEASVSTS